MNQEIPFCPFLAKDKFLSIVMNGIPFFDVNLMNMKYKSLGRPFVPLLRLLPNHNTGLCPTSHFHRKTSHFPLLQKKLPTSTKNFPLTTRLYFLHFFANSRFQYFASPSSSLFFCAFLSTGVKFLLAHQGFKTFS